MKYMMLKEVCSIKMGQSPASDSYNDNGEGVPFFQGNADFGERYPVARKWCSAPMKMAEPEDIAKMVYFLGNPANTFISGQDIIVDGGFMAGSYQTIRR